MSHISWSSIHHLQDYSDAPARAGIYLIGFLNNNIRETGNKNEDTFFGANYPRNFDAMYVGITQNSIRTRLSSHCLGTGNRYVREHEKEKLHYVYFETKDTQIEHLFLIATQNMFVWNIRRSEISALLKKMIKISEDGSKSRIHGDDDSLGWGIGSGKELIWDD